MYSGEFSIHLGKMGMRRVPCHRVSMRSKENDTQSEECSASPRAVQKMLPHSQCPVITVMAIIQVDATFQYLVGFVSMTHSP